MKITVTSPGSGYGMHEEVTMTVVCRTTRERGETREEKRQKQEKREGEKSRAMQVSES